jgi:hypothetical protein
MVLLEHCAQGPIGGAEASARRRPRRVAAIVSEIYDVV